MGEMSNILYAGCTLVLPIDECEIMLDEYLGLVLNIVPKVFNPNRLEPREGIPFIYLEY